MQTEYHGNHPVEGGKIMPTLPDSGVGREWPLDRDCDDQWLTRFLAGEEEYEGKRD